MKEFLLNLLTSTLETIGESKLIEILQKLHDKNLAQYKAAIYGGQALCDALGGFVTGTTTKIDDAILGAIRDAIKVSAAANGIDITVPVTIAPTAELDPAL